MRKFIDLMESIGDDSLVDHISTMVRQGYHEGYGPYWKLNADPRLLEDEAAMHHIADLIAAGFTSGHHPTWDLTVIEKTDDTHPAITADGEDVGEVEDRMAKKHPELDEEIVDEEIVDEAPKPKHKVVAVNQKMGAGAGWWECPDEEAELFVVEDDMGEPVESYSDRNAAEAHAHHLNGDETPDEGEQLLTDEDTDPTDNGDIPYDHPDMVAGRAIQDHLDAEHMASADTMYASAPDHEVEVAAIFKRGHEQDEAMRELAVRGIHLTPDQSAMAGR